MNATRIMSFSRFLPRPQHLIIGAFLLLMLGCTTGKLYYTNQSGERKLACDVEFVGLPSVDKYAVEYALSLCAKDASRKGFTIDEPQQYLLSLTLEIPAPPCDRTWDHDLAKAAYQDGTLSSKAYGYIVAHIDLGLAKLNICETHVQN